MGTFEDYLKELRGRGRRHFTRDEALRDMNLSADALHSAIYRLKKKGEIVTPAKNLYIIVPPEEKIFGCIPAPDLIPILMKYLDLPYYACLLTAAMYHGSAHQAPQVFQVMTNKRLKPLRFGRMRIGFIYKKNMEDLPVMQRASETGYLNLSTPELTTLDMLLYPRKCGGLNHTATVLTELIEAIRPYTLVKLIKKLGGRTLAQRLGYILENIETEDEKKKAKIIEYLQKYLASTEGFYMPIAPEVPIRKGTTRNSKWQIIENTTVESD